MLKGLSEQELKLLEEYVESQKASGKNQAEIMKDAGTKAMLFFLFIMIVVAFIVIACIIIAGGDFNKISHGLS